jgi:hypothetical protein
VLASHMAKEMSLVHEVLMVAFSAVIIQSMLGLMFEPLFSVGECRVMFLTLRKCANIRLEVFQNMLPCKNVKSIQPHIYAP